MNIFNCVNQFLKLASLKRMSKETALQILDFGINDNPSERDISSRVTLLRANNHPDKVREDWQKKINHLKTVYIGMAGNTLLGNRELYDGEEFKLIFPAIKSDVDLPTKSYNPTYSEESSTSKPIVISFDEAKANVGYDLNNVQWHFITQPVTAGYDSDDSSRWTTGWIAVGETVEQNIKKVVFALVEHTARQDYYMHINNDLYRIEISDDIIFGDSLDYGTCLRGIIETWSNFKDVKKEFNNKIIIKKTFTENTDGPTITLKSYFASNGSTRKIKQNPRNIELILEIWHDRFGRPPIDFIPIGMWDYQKISIIVDGSIFVLPPHIIKTIVDSNFDGKDFRLWMEIGAITDHTKSIYKYKNSLNAKRGHGKVKLLAIIRNSPDIPQALRDLLNDTQSTQSTQPTQPTQSTRTRPTHPKEHAGPRDPEPVKQDNDKEMSKLEKIKILQAAVKDGFKRHELGELVKKLDLKPTFANVTALMNNESIDALLKLF